MNNYNQIEILSAKENLDFIILSETHLTQDIELNEIMLPKFKQIISYSNSRRTGGVIIYYKDVWTVSKVYEKVKDSNYWILACVAQCSKNYILICAIYRSPSGSEAEFCEAFQEALDFISERNCDMIITGDFNIDWSKNGFYKNRMQSAINNNGQKQIVNQFTRITDTSKTIIDYVITNSHKVSVQFNSTDNISDHEIINILIKSDNIKSSSNTQMNIFKYKPHQFHRELSAIIGYEDDKDINYNVNYIDKCFNETVKKFSSKVYIKEQCKTDQWYTNDLGEMKKDKIILYERAQYENTTAAWKNYALIRNQYKVAIENAKYDFVNGEINKAKDQKQMWTTIKNLVIKKKPNVIKSVVFNDVEHKNNYKIACEFNKYYVDSIKSIREAIDDVQYNNNIPMTDKKFKFRAINMLDLKNIVKNLKNKSDYEKITPKMLLDNWNEIGKILLRIINESLETGTFPENWKVTMITPIEKIANTKKCDEFRPINSLKTCEKIMEKVVKEQLEKYIEDNSILTRHQSGFRKNFSCETTVNYVINRWKNIEKNKKIIAIFLDFKRAFETIDRELLLDKLHNYGIQGTELKWFKSYLTNRKQFTKVNDTISENLDNVYGVPQGSILGALLFIIYINDMPNVLRNSEMVLYADDTLIFTEGHNDEECRDKMISDLDNINEWLKMNKLKLNEKKTKIMEINMTSEINIDLNGETIEKVDHIKYLGFIIDKKLNFNEHIEYICKKIGKKIGFFKRIRNKLNVLTAINIYNTIIKPHFEYGSTILYTCCTETHLERLQKLQNKAMRSILKLNRYASINTMLNTLKWLSIKQRLALNTLKLIRKIKLGNAPDYLCEQIRYVGEVQPYSLRSADNFRLPRAATSSMQRSLFIKGFKLFNSLPNIVKTETNVNEFNKQCVFFVRNNL